MQPFKNRAVPQPRPERRFGRCWQVFLFSCFTTSVAAGDIAVAVKDNSGAPVKDAVVYAMPVSGKPPALKARAVVVQQHDKQFVPFVSAVQVGGPVQFPNLDSVKHHVYSFSPAKKFELPLYAGTPPAPIVFDQPGVVTLGCNIHDWMIGYVLVVPTPWFSVTGADGAATLRDLPAGTYDLEIWQPRLRDLSSRPRQRATADASISFQLDLKPDFRLRRSPADSSGGYR